MGKEELSRVLERDDACCWVEAQGGEGGRPRIGLVRAG